MTRGHFFQGVVFLAGLAAGFLVVSEALAKNPFMSFLPEKPKKEELAVDKEIQRMITEASVPPKVEVKVIPPELALNGLIWNSFMPQAIVSGEVVKVGDVVQKVKIRKITRDGVEGDFEGVKVYLKP